jgi:glycosyltransferase involved in cell wall biosynthesis
VYFADVRLPIERANGIQTVETIHALARRGHLVTLVCRPDTERPPRDALAYYGLNEVPTLSLSRVRVWGPAILRRTQYVVAAAAWSVGRASSDVLMTRDLGVASLLLRVPRALRPPLVYESHGFAPKVAAEMADLLSTGRRASAIKQQRLLGRERHVWVKAEGYVTITRGLLDELSATFGTRGAAVVVPDGARLADTPSQIPGSAHSTPVVAYAGHLYPWKGVDVLIEALALVPHVRGLIVGGHPREGDLDRVRARASALGLSDRIEFTGQVAPAEVRSRLASADILILPNRRTQTSAHYTSPLKLFEYLSLGKPIVASDLPALREILTPGVTAELVEADAPAALAAGIVRVVGAPAHAAALGSAARQLAAEFSWDTRAARLEALFTSLSAARA